MVEKPSKEDTPSNLAVIGRYILSPNVLQNLNEIKSGAGGEIQLTDGIAAMLESNRVLAYPFEGERYDCGSRQGFIKATIDYALEHEELRADMIEHMQALLTKSGSR